MYRVFFVLFVLIFLQSCKPDTSSSHQNVEGGQLKYNVRALKSPKGSDYWLLQDDQTPRIVVNINFKSGSAYDAQDKFGSMDFYAALVTKGAGNFTEKEFYEQLEEIGSSLNVSVDSDKLSMNIVMLKEALHKTSSLVKLVIKSPRFDKDSIENTRKEMLAVRKQSLHSAQFMIAQKMNDIYLINHPYVRNPLDHEKLIHEIQEKDLRKIHSEVFSLIPYITMVGNISPEEAGELVDNLLETQVRKKQTKKIPPLNFQNIARVTPVPSLVRQATILATHKGPKASSEDSISLALITRILDRWVWEKVREEKGLAYFIYVQRLPLEKGGFIRCMGGTKVESVHEVMHIIDQCWNEMHQKGPTEKDLQEAKDFLMNYVTMLPDSPSLSEILAGYQFYGRSPDYINKRILKIESVSLNEAKRVAQKYIKPKNLRFFVHGMSEKKEP